MARRAVRSGWKHSSGVYLRFTLAHFAYVLVLTIPAALMLLALDLSIVVAALLFAELFAFLATPYFGCVRRAVEERLEARAHAEAASARAVLLMRMSDEHRRELNALERIGASLRDRADASSTEDFLGVERLIELFVRLAIAHRQSRLSLEVVGRSRLDEEIAALEACRARGRPESPAVEKRLHILRMRRDARRAALTEQAAIEHELALIGHTLRWMEEHSATTGLESLRTELDIALSDRERDAATLRELAAMRDSDFDASVLRLGREQATPLRGEPLVRIAVASQGLENDDGLSIVTSEANALLVRM